MKEKIITTLKKSFYQISVGLEKFVNTNFFKYTGLLALGFIIGIIVAAL